MIRFTRQTLAEARAHLAPMMGNPKWDISDGMYSVDELLGRGVAFAAADDDGPLMLIVVEQVQHANGRELVIRVARQLAGNGDLTERILPEIERVFGYGCKAVTIYTRRAGLVRKLQAAGYGETAVLMRKALP